MLNKALPTNKNWRRERSDVVATRAVQEGRVAAVALAARPRKIVPPPRRHLGTDLSADIERRAKEAVRQRYQVDRDLPERRGLLFAEARRIEDERGNWKACLRAPLF